MFTQEFLVLLHDFLPAHKVLVGLGDGHDDGFDFGTGITDKIHLGLRDGGRRIAHDHQHTRLVHRHFRQRRQLRVQPAHTRGIHNGDTLQRHPADRNGGAGGQGIRVLLRGTHGTSIDPFTHLIEAHDFFTVGVEQAGLALP